VGARQKRTGVWCRCARFKNANPLVGEKEHLRWNWIGFIFVRQAAGVRQAGQNILSRQPRITRQKFAHVHVLRGEDGALIKARFKTIPNQQWLVVREMKTYGRTPIRVSFPIRVYLCLSVANMPSYTFASAPSSFTMLDKNAFASPNNISVLSR